MKIEKATEAMEEKKRMEFWAFDADDPQLLRFCDAHPDLDSLYCIVHVEECSRSYSNQLRELLHLRNGALLMVDTPLIPIYARLKLKGQFIMLSESFCETGQTRALLKFCFFHKTPEAMSDSGDLTEEQKVCMALIREEYRLPHDDLQPYILRNLLRNLLLLSTKTHAYTMHLKAGHLLANALEFIGLLEEFAFHEKRKTFYFEKMGITEAALTHVLRTVFCKSFKEMLAQYAVISAMKKLVFSNQNIARIAHECNFDTPDFNKLVLKEKGMQPLELRQQYRQILNQI